MLYEVITIGNDPEFLIGTHQKFKILAIGQVDDVHALVQIFPSFKYGPALMIEGGSVVGINGFVHVMRQNNGGVRKPINFNTNFRITSYNVCYTKLLRTTPVSG